MVEKRKNRTNSDCIYITPPATLLQKYVDALGYISFRGKPLSGSVLQQLIDNEGGLISFNGFLSTTFDPGVSSMYDGREAVHKENTSVLFRLYIDNCVKTPFADISVCSAKPDESEILFSLGTVWRIESIESDNNLYIIELQIMRRIGFKCEEAV